MCMIVRTEKRTVFRWLNVIFMISLLDFMATNIFLKYEHDLLQWERESPFNSEGAVNAI